MTRSIRLILWILVPIAFFWIWYCVAANYSYNAVSGVYGLERNGEASTLILKKDRSFYQVLTENGKVECTQGTWRRIGEGGIVFSKEFLKMAGQETRADGQVDGDVKKRFGIFLAIQFNPDPGGPVFRKKMFR